MGDPKTNKELFRAIQEASRPRASSRAPVSNALEIRKLRAQVASLEEKLGDLQSKWRDEVQDDLTLASAKNSIVEKHARAQTEDVHTGLEHLLEQQQFLFATLQTAISRAPLSSSGNEIYEALHFNTQLGLNPIEREKALLQHCQQSLSTLPSIVDKLVQMTVDKFKEYQEADDEEELNFPLEPFSWIDITGCEGYTLVSSTFISEIPSTSLNEVYAAVLAYLESIPSLMKRHFGIEARRTRLNSEESPVNYRQSTFNGVGLRSTVNNIMCSELTLSHGMVHVDAITDDPLHPIDAANSLKYSICALTITPRKNQGRN
ncbi:unnamed protein product [Phytophthora lilii]|uniref:Unnamed protein product n=1 Tax=Phytophthora lilii TaxID=2077276 RepID=A0A9W6U5P6_9STRA|nr:unnamed protein product [Phytophthora lilii]